MALLEWRSQFATGVGVVDEQHQRLVGLVNQLYEAISEFRGHEILGQILGGLVEYADYHFKTEEELMSSHGYPALEQHRQEHLKLTAKVKEFVERFEQGKDRILLELARFLKDWLADHMLVTDQKFAPFFREKGVN